MVTKTIIVCDSCKKENIPESGCLSILTGYSPSPAGGSAEPDYTYIDLCPLCLAKTLLTLIQDKKIEGKVLVEHLRTKLNVSVYGRRA